MIWKDRAAGFWYAGILIIMFFGLMLLLPGCRKGQGREGQSPPVVEVVDVIRKDVPVYSEWIA
jgi:hypothetical protein